MKIIKSSGLLLGFAAETKYEDHEIELSSGDQIYMLTDGILESRDSDGIPIETHGLIDILMKKSKGNILDSIKAKISKITNEHFEDDISVICICVE